MYHKYWECRHIMPNGLKCHAPALKGKPYCYFHTRLHVLRKAPAPGPLASLKIGVLEDKTAIQVAVAQVLEALGSNSIDPRRAGLFLYAIQLVSQNIERKIDVIPFCAVESMTETSDGEELGPKNFFCTSDDECDECDIRDSCFQFAPLEYEQDEGGEEDEDDEDQVDEGEDDKDDEDPVDEGEDDEDQVDEDQVDKEQVDEDE
jgi:hypothetical protein